MDKDLCVDCGCPLECHGYEHLAESCLPARIEALENEIEELKAELKAEKERKS